MQVPTSTGVTEALMVHKPDQHVAAKYIPAGTDRQNIDQFCMAIREFYKHMKQLHSGMVGSYLFDFVPCFC